jgi:hypothetical protein
MELDSEPAVWAEQLAPISSRLRFSTPLVGVPSTDRRGFVRRLGEDVARRVRAMLG